MPVKDSTKRGKLNSIYKKENSINHTRKSDSRKLLPE
jgi:hypothetical protein